MAFKKYIHRHGKRPGLHNYENVRSPDESIKTVYIDTNPIQPPKHKTRKPLIFSIVALLLILILGGSLLFLQNKAYLIKSVKPQGLDSGAQLCNNGVLQPELSITIILVLFVLTACFFFFMGAYLYEKTTVAMPEPEKEKERVSEEKLEEGLRLAKGTKEIKEAPSKKLRDFCNLLDELDDAVDSKDISTADELYIKAIDAYTTLENQEKQEVYDKLTALYNKRNELAKETERQDELRRKEELTRQKLMEEQRALEEKKKLEEERIRAQKLGLIKQLEDKLSKSKETAENLKAELKKLEPAEGLLSGNITKADLRIKKIDGEILSISKDKEGVSKKQKELKKAIAGLESQKQQILLEKKNALSSLASTDKEIQKIRLKLKNIAKKQEQLKSELSKLKPIRFGGFFSSLISGYRGKPQETEEAAKESIEKRQKELEKKKTFDEKGKFERKKQEELKIQKAEERKNRFKEFFHKIRLYKTPAEKKEIALQKLEALTTRDKLKRQKEEEKTLKKLEEEKKRKEERKAKEEQRRQRQEKLSKLQEQLKKQSESEKKSAEPILEQPKRSLLERLFKREPFRFNETDNKIEEKKITEKKTDVVVPLIGKIKSEEKPQRRKEPKKHKIPKSEVEELEEAIRNLGLFKQIEEEKFGLGEKSEKESGKKKFSIFGRLFKKE